MGICPTAADCLIMVGMARVIRPWQIFVVAAAGWISRHQDAVIEYLREENRVLRQQLEGRRLRLTDAQRRRLAAERKGPRLPDVVRGRYDRDAGHDPSLASAADREEVGLQQET